MCVAGLVGQGSLLLYPTMGWTNTQGKSKPGPVYSSGETKSLYLLGLVCMALTWHLHND